MTATAMEIADSLVVMLRGKVPIDAPAEARAEAIARMCAQQYRGLSDELLREAIGIANEKIRTSRPALRPVKAVSIVGLDIGDPENDEPICERVDPKVLFVDPAYQRDIGDRGLRLIRRIIEAWDWNKFEPPSCTYAEYEGQTVLKVFDGQHTAIAAASHPHIGEIPIMIHAASETKAQAAAFVGQNSGRLAVTALQVHQAALVAGDDDALTVASVCDRAGVRVLKFSVKTFAPGDTVAIQAINALVDKRGARQARIILEVLAKAGMAPIVKPQINAVELLLTDDEYKHAITPEALTEAITGGWITDQDEGKRISLSHKWPFWKALAIVWFRKTKKVRTATGRAT